MGIFREIPPTAGLPVYLREIISLFKFSRPSLESDFRAYLNVNYARVTNSGTAAFYLILEGLKELSVKRTVIIPAFTCPLVPLAIKRAGLKVEVCDINEDNFNFDLAGLEKICSLNYDILAIIPTHLGGIPVEFEPIEKIAKAYNIFIVEDCAQSLGAIYKGKKVGTLGDFSFFSLCRGKGLTIYEGGVIVANKEEYAPVIDNKIKQLVKNNFFSETLKILELFGYWIFYRPHFFWFIFSLPKIFWNLQRNKFRADIEYFEIDFLIHNVSETRKIIGHAGFYRIDAEIIKQREKARYYIEGLEKINCPGARIIKEPVNSQANFPYVTLIFSEPAQKEKALKNFQDSGLGVSQIYALPITGYDYLKGAIPDRHFPCAAYLAEREITLSTSTFMRKKDLDLILKKLGDYK